MKLLIPVGKRYVIEEAFELHIRPIDRDKYSG
jgi:hypothetical protein